MADLHTETFTLDDWEFNTELGATGLPGWAEKFHPRGNPGQYPPTRDEDASPYKRND
jgi:hypothetical protein